MMNDVERENLAFIESCMALSGCDRETAEDTLRELADATVGTPCPLYRAKRRLLDRLECGDSSGSYDRRNPPSVRVKNALEYAKSFMLPLKIE